MEASVTFREATQADLPDILALLAQPDMDGAALPPAEAEHVFARMARYPDYHLYVALVDGRIVGSFALLILDTLGHRGTPSGVIEDVVVASAWQRHGIGRAMMRHALRLCGEKRCYKAMLSSNLSRERAHAFYESLGFERHGHSFKIAAPSSTASD